MNSSQFNPEERAAYVVLFPHSLTNSTDNYIVTTAGAWLDAYNSATTLTGGIASFTSHAEAKLRADELNAFLGLSRIEQSREVAS